ncbi:MAG: HupE/UreJ family protein [Verrucomicrobiota bacterium]
MKPGSITLLSTLLCLALTTNARSHADEENYIWLDIQDTSISGHFEIPFRNLRENVGLKIPNGFDRSRPAVRETSEETHQYIRDHFSIGPFNGTPYEIIFTHQDVIGDIGGFGQFYFEIDCGGPVPDQLEIKNALFLTEKGIHRSLLCILYNAKTGEDYRDGEYAALVFNATNTIQILDLLGITGLFTPEQVEAAGWRRNVSALPQLLFFITTLLAAVLIANNKTWAPAPTLKKALQTFIPLYLTFALAQSLAFWLSVHNKIHLGITFVQVAVALSIALMAWRNRSTRAPAGTALIILFFLGFFHGLWLANGLDNLRVRIVDIEEMSRRFFTGFQLGQCALAVGLFTAFFLLRKARFYIPVLLQRGSLAALILALIWVSWKTTIAS